MARPREWTSRNGGTVTVEHCTIYGTKRETVGTVREVLDASQVAFADARYVCLWMLQAQKIGSYDFPQNIIDLANRVVLAEE